MAAEMTEERLAVIEANAAHETVISYPEIDATPASVARGWCRIVRELCDEVRRLRYETQEEHWRAGYVDLSAALTQLLADLEAERLAIAWTPAGAREADWRRQVAARLEAVLEGRHE